MKKSIIIGGCLVVLIIFLLSIRGCYHSPPKIIEQIESKLESLIEESSPKRSEIQSIIQEPKIDLKTEKVLPSVEPKTPEKSVEKPKKGIGWKGQYFSTFEEFKNSPAYQELLKERAEKNRIRELEEENAKKRYDTAGEILKKNRYRSEVDSARDESIRRGNEIINQGKK